MSASGTKRTLRDWVPMSAFGGATDTADLWPKTRHFLNPAGQKPHPGPHVGQDVCDCPQLLHGHGGDRPPMQPRRRWWALPAAVVRRRTESLLGRPRPRLCAKLKRRFSALQMTWCERARPMMHVQALHVARRERRDRSVNSLRMMLARRK